MKRRALLAGSGKISGLNNVEFSLYANLSMTISTFLKSTEDTKLEN
jgi:hypothetical protein